MNFTCNTSFTTSYGRLHKGNKHDSEELGASDADVMRWYEHGFVEVEGKDPAPPRDPSRVTINPKSAQHRQSADSV